MINLRDLYHGPGARTGGSQCGFAVETISLEN
jgi:hypothetical protein